MKKPLPLFLTFAGLIGSVVLSSPAAELDYSTYLGGTATDAGFSIAVDSLSRAVVTGRTFSADFPLQDPYQSSIGGGDNDAFVCRLTSSGSSLDYCTYLGGKGSEAANRVTLSPGLEVWLTGYTDSDDFPTLNPYQASPGGGYDAFITRLSSTGSYLVYSTYLGGSGWDYGGKIAVSADGRVYLCGSTESVDFPTRNAYQDTRAGDYDVFAGKFSSSGSRLLYSTYLGGGAGDYDGGIAADSGFICLSGYTSSDDFPTRYPCQPGRAGSSDVFVARISLSGSGLIYSTYLGGARLTARPISPSVFRAMSS